MEFLALAAGLTIIGVTIVLIRHRRPQGLNAGIEDFAARRDALAPDETPQARGHRSE